MALTVHGIRDALNQREEGHHEKEFHPGRKESRIRGSISFTGVFASLGCNTVHGLGPDIERGGEKTQDAADAVKRRM